MTRFLPELERRIAVAEQLGHRNTFGERIVTLTVSEANAVLALVRACKEYQREADLPLAATDLGLRARRRREMFAALAALDAAQKEGQ